MEILKSNNSLGAEIKNVDLGKELQKQELNFINKAWEEHLVLVFKKQNLTDERLIQYSKNFGDLDLPAPNPYGINFSPDHPEINVISNVKDMGLDGHLNLVLQKIYLMSMMSNHLNRQNHSQV